MVVLSFEMLLINCPYIAGFCSNSNLLQPCMHAADELVSSFGYALVLIFKERVLLSIIGLFLMKHI